MYNYPQDKEMGKAPEAIVNLESSLQPLSETKKCPRKNSFILKVKPPKSTVEAKFICLKQNGFPPKTYLLAADNKDEVEKWTEEFNYIFQSLQNWNKFISTNTV